MRVYSALDEENIRDGNLVREWTASGLLDSTQSSLLRTELETDLRQTNVFLRGVLWIFTTLIVITGVGLLATIDSRMSHTQGATLFIVSGVVCWVLAEIACRNRLYRYGVEESLAVCAAVLFAVGSSEIFHESGEWATISGLAVGSIAGLAIYLRFGFIYAAVGSLAACAAIPFQLDIGIAGKRFTAALIFAAVLAIVRWQRQESEEPAGSGLASIEAAAWLGTYLMFNVQLSSGFFAVPLWLFYSPYRSSSPEIATWFFIFCWAMIWLLPAAGLWLGLAKKDRLLIDVSLAMTLLTLTTNKRYLGWAVHSWDPMILGVVLMTAAIVIRRRLQSGPNGERDGFTALRLLRSDERKLAAVSIASSVMQPHTSNTKHTDAPHDFREGGGSSGGGGASGSF